MSAIRSRYSRIVILAGAAVGAAIFAVADAAYGQPGNAVAGDKEMTGGQRLEFGVKKMKENLGGITQFVCRYTIQDCRASTLEDALADRNVSRGKGGWHVLWIVKKPVERILVVTDKKRLDQPVSGIQPAEVQVRPIDPATGKGSFVPKVWANSLWDGEFHIRVAEGIPVTAIRRGLPTGMHPRCPGTPLEGEFFQYTDPDYYFVNFGDSKVTFTGVGSDGLWKFERGLSKQRPNSKIALDPQHGFLPVRGSSWAQWGKGEGFSKTGTLPTSRRRRMASG
jgi:hypothetical protein